MVWRVYGTRQQPTKHKFIFQKKTSFLSQHKQIKADDARLYVRSMLTFANKGNNEFILQL